MLKRTIGRFLLTLLVITGLAGTYKDGSISQKERKQAITLMKSSRSEILNSVQSLSARQLKYKPASKETSIGELITKMVSLEKNCIEQIKTVMSEPSNAENRLRIAHTDEQLLADKNYSFCKTQIPAEYKIHLKDPAIAIKEFTDLRDHHIKYIRTSTEGLRNHVVETAAGWIDCYQYYLLIAKQSSYFTSMINQIKSSTGFPKK